MKPLPQIPTNDPIFWQWVQRHLANFETVSAIPTVENLKKGDTILYESGTTKRLYFNLNGTILFITIGSGIAGEHGHTKIRDTDNDTGWEAERNSDDDNLRGRTAGVDRITINETGVTVVNNLIVDGNVEADDRDVLRYTMLAGG